MIHALVLAAALAAPGPATAPSQENPMDTVPAGVVDGATARRLVAAGVTVVDVRTPEEFAAGHVPGAKNIPFDQIARRAAEIGPPSTPVLVYCRTGRRSGAAAADLRRLGYERLWDMRSFDAWRGGQ